MADILQTALFEADIDFGTDTVTNDVPPQNAPMPQLVPQITNKADSSIPPESMQSQRVQPKKIFQPRVSPQVIPPATQPLVLVAQPRVNVPASSNSSSSQKQQPPRRTFVTNNGRKFVVIGAPQQQRIPMMVSPPQFINRSLPQVVNRNLPQVVNRSLPQVISRNRVIPPMHQNFTPRRVITPPTRQPVQKMLPAKKNSFTSYQQPQANSNSNVKVPQPSQKSQPAQSKVNRSIEWSKEHHEDIEEDEKVIELNTFIDYKPLKLRSGLQHPDPVVETASLSGVSAPDIRYNMAIPEEIIDEGRISALQLEAALYACQAHEKILPSGERQGYLIGDGPGIGKGRTIATVIYENWLRGRRRAIWVSVSSDLNYDAMRDLRDIGADEIDVIQLSSLRYAKISSPENGNVKKGVIFSTYHALVGEIRKKEDGNGASNKITSRLDQLVQWCGEDFDGLIVFDECHHAKNLMTSAGGKGGTKTGRYVLKIQEELPNARVIYASATGATEPRDMAYMVRLGLWGPSQAFADFGQFLKAVEDRGVGSMELVALDLKLRGLYLARQLSFAGVEFNIQEVLLSNEFIQMYDESVKLWMEVRRQFQYAIDHTRTDTNTQKRVWSFFWASHQRFFKYLCIGAKVQQCVQVAQQALADGKCVVIGLQSTGEAQTKHVLADMGEITDFVSSTKSVIQSLIEKHFPTGDSGGSDIFEDMDKMHSIGSGAQVQLNGRKRRMNTSLNTAPLSKRRTHRNSTGSPNEDEQSTDSENEEESDASSENSDLSDDGFDDEDSEIEADGDSGFASDKKKATDDALFKTLMGELDDADFEVDPFHHDFSTAVDPWAHLQTQEDKTFNAAEKERLDEEKRQKLKIRRKIRRRERREQLEKERTLAEAREMESQLLLQRKQDLKFSTATDFMESTRVIDSALRNGDSLSLMTIKAELLTAVERLGKILPPNTLDQLIDELGGTQQVAEMTGRKGRIVILPNGQVEYQARNADSDAPVSQMNLEEKDKFMRGEKLIAVISEAASSGISLQSDKRVPNQRRRVHITLELPWAGDKAIQQFGRTHRSNQANAPEYLFLISELAGEKRFASVVAKRLESLGALTHGDRRAADSRDLSQFNLDNAYGREALKKLVQSLSNVSVKPIIPAPEDYMLGPDKFFDDMRQYLVGVGILSVNKRTPNIFNVEKEATVLSKFLNRLLGLPFHAQNALFSYFTSIINKLIKQAKDNGTFDAGILVLGGETDHAKKLEQRVFRGVAGNPNFIVEIHKIGAERGLKWEDAKELYDKQTDPNAGFYLSHPITDRKQTIILATSNDKTTAKNMCIFRPNTGRSNKFQSPTDITTKFDKVSLKEAEKEWNKQYEAFGSMCLHRYVNGQCKKEDLQDTKEFCEFGRRFRTYFVLTGAVIAIWPMLEKALNESRTKQQNSYMQIVRITTDDGQKLVGLLVLPTHVRSILAILTSQSQKPN